METAGAYRYPNQAFVLRQAGPKYFNAEAITPGNPAIGMVHGYGSTVEFY